MSRRDDGESIGKVIKFINDNRNHLVLGEDDVTKLYFRPRPFGVTFGFGGGGTYILFIFRASILFLVIFQ